MAVRQRGFVNDNLTHSPRAALLALGATFESNHSFRHITFVDEEI